MMRNLTLLALLIGYSMPICAQMGINTDAPKATFEVREKRNISVANDITEGLIIPKVTVTELANKYSNAYATRINSSEGGLNNHEGNLVFVVDGDDLQNPPTVGNSVSRIQKIKKEGFYFLNNAGEWEPVGNINEYWSKNRSLNNIHLSHNSNSNIRNNLNDLVIHDAGYLGLNTNTPTKRLHIDAENENIRIRNLSTNEQQGDVNSLVTDDDGNLYRNAIANYKNQIIRIPLAGSIATEATQVALRFAPDIQTSTSPSGHSNFINTIKDAEVEFNHEYIQGGSGTIPRITDRIKLKRGIYKVTVRLTGYFRNTLSQRGFFIKLAVNNRELSVQNFNTNTSADGLTTFTYTEFLNLNTENNYIDFLQDTFGLDELINFVVTSHKDVDNYKSIQSLVLVQRLR